MNLQTSWNLVAHVGGGHFFFSDGHGNVAIADESIRDIKNPASADDGLLLADKKAEVRVDASGIYIPVRTKSGSPAFVIESLSKAWMVLPLIKAFGMNVKAPPAYAANLRAIVNSLPEES